jgi:hypothetical protein
MMVRYLAAACVVAVVLFLSGLLFSNEKTSATQLADNYIKKEFSELGVTMGGQADSMQKDWLYTMKVNGKKRYHL